MPRTWQAWLYFKLEGSGLWKVKWQQWTPLAFSGNWYRYPDKHHSYREVRRSSSRPRVGSSHCQWSFPHDPGRDPRPDYLIRQSTYSPPPSFLFVSSFFSSSIFSFYQPNFLYLVKWYLIHVYTELYLVSLILNIESFCLKSLLIVSFCFIIMFPLFFELLQCSSWYGGKWSDPVYTNNLPSLNEIMPLDTKK